MDLLSRITGSPRASKLRTRDPRARFDSTKEICSDLVERLAIPSEQRNYDDLEQDLSNLTQIFFNEQNQAADLDVCTVYFIKQGALATVVESFKEMPVWMFSTVCALFRTIFDADQDNIFRDKQFIVCTDRFLCDMAQGVRIDRSSEEEFSQLLFIIASKLKTHPQLVDHWLSNLLSASDEISDVKFPLCYLLLDYVYHEGNVGEYARTGLLYLVDMIATSDLLEKWVLKSDMCTLIASGLGALYSQLNRGVAKLDALSNAEMPAIVTLSLGESDIAMFGARARAEIAEYKANVENFIGYLHFWQDMIGYCKSTQLAKKLISHFDVLFVRRLLYPSIIQSTDNNGGFSVPLLTVLRYILEVLDHNRMSEVILQYFLGHKIPADNTVEESNDLLNDDNDAENLITLRDILLTCLESSQEKSKVAALQLLSVLIRKFYPYLINTLFTVVAVNESSVPTGTVPEYLYVREMALLRGMRQDIGCEDLSISGYESDIEMRIVNSPFPTTKQLHALLPEERERRTVMEIDRELFPHAIKPEDKLMRRIYELLLNFFTNTTELNLALSGVLIDLGSCAWCSLRSWLLVFDTTELQVQASSTERKETDTAILANTKVLQVLQDLSNQYQHYAVTIDQFNRGIYEFEKALKVREELGDAIHHEHTNTHTPQLSSETDDEASAVAPSTPTNQLFDTGDQSGSRDSPTPILTTPVRRVRKSLSRLNLPKLRAAVNVDRPISRESSNSTLSSTGNDMHVRAIRPSLQTLRSISGASRIPSHLDFDRNGINDGEAEEERDYFDDTSRDVRLAQVYANIIVLREFLNEIEALIYIRAWLLA